MNENMPSVNLQERLISGWFTWQTAIGSVVLAVIFAGVLFWFTKQPFSLSGLELFFTLTTIISLGFNLWQLFRDRYKYAPLRDSLIGLLNDLKGRQLRAYLRQQLITSHAGMTLPIEAIRLEFYDFVQGTTQDLEQLKEHIVASIHTLDPNVSNKEVFRAAEFGLTDQELQFRKEGMERFIAASRAPATPGSPQEHMPTAAVASSSELPPGAA